MNDAQKSTVLIVEDSDTEALGLTLILEKEGYQVLCAEDGFKALTLLEKERPAIIISDVIMPGMNGYEFCRRVKSNKKLQNIPVVLVTTLSDPGDVIKGLECRADNFIAKPYETEEVLRRIHYVLGNVETGQLKETGESVEIYFNNEWHTITSNRKQVIDLLLSTFYSAMSQNQELQSTQAKLREKNRTLRRANEKLEKEQQVSDGKGRAIEALNQELKMKASELLKINANLEVLRREAESASQAKSEFLAKMTHDIRTPLNGIVGMCDLLFSTQLDERQYRYAKILKSSSNSLALLINDILDFSKIEAGKLELVHEEFDVLKTIEEVSTNLSYQASKKGLELICYVNPNVPQLIVGDPDRLWQVLVNLINNAVKFTPFGRIVVRARLLDEDEQSVKVYFEVSDTGIGIEKDETKELFEAFAQADLSTTRKYGGSGLGLAICKQLVEMMNGEIGVESGEGAGSLFWFTASFDKTETQISEEYSKEYIAQQSILVVDDSEVNGTILKKQLEDIGVGRVSVVMSGEDALSVLKSSEEPFDTAFIDFHMEEMNGIELAQAIKKDLELDSITLILLSSVESDHDLRSLRKLGFSRFMSKPVRRSVLASILNSNLTTEESDKDFSTEVVFVKTNRSINVLVAEDNEVNQLVITEFLANYGLQCTLVGNGKEAVNAALSGEFDVVLMDCEMPVMDGLEATKMIREHETLAGGYVYLPIMALTANAQVSFRKKCLDAGMTDFCVKPIDSRLMMQKIHEILDCDYVDPGDDGGVGVIETDIECSINQDILSRFTMNRVDLAKRSLEVFKNQLEEDLSGLKAAYAEKNLLRICSLTHSLRGSARIVGASKLAEITEKCERAIKDENEDEIALVMSELIDEIDSCRTYIPRLYIQLGED